MKNVSSKLHIRFTKKKCILLLISLLLLALFALFLFRPFRDEKATKDSQTATVTRGRIVKTIDGTGVIEAIDQYTISALVTGEVLRDHFSEGDIVKKDTLLYEIDSTNLNYSLEKAESSVESARLSYSEALESQKNQSITTPISGVITALHVQESDEINAGTLVAEIVSSDNMILTLPFLSSDAKNIFPGNPATVVPESAPALSLSGTVKSVSTGSTANRYGAEITYVQILIPNPGGLADGDRATASVDKYACNEAGTFSVEKSEKITAKTGGTVTGLSVQKGDRVTTGMLLCTLESASTTRTITRSQLSYEDAIRSRDNTFDQLEDYRIKAPITGKVIQKNVKAGDKLEGGGNASSMAIIADLSTLTFEISVDELDIAKVQKGQEVRVIADAVEGQTFIGHVENVSIVGTAQNGVTSYPVKVTLDGEDNDALIPGMNVNATIVVEDKQDILIIPVSAVSRGNIVAVKGDAPNTKTPANEGKKPAGGTKQASAGTESASVRTKQKAAEGAFASTPPEGYHYVQIKTGITDGTYIEVLSGLSEGDVVLLPESAGGTGSSVIFTPNAATPMMGMPMGGMGGMGGPMPGRARNQAGR